MKIMKAQKEECLPANFYVQSCQSAERARAYSLLQACKNDLRETAGGSPVMYQDLKLLSKSEK